MSDHLQKAVAAISLFRGLNDPNSSTYEANLDARLAAISEVVESLLEVVVDLDKRLADAEVAPAGVSG